MTQSHILFEAREGIAHIRFNRPEVLNALTREVLQALSGCFENVARDDAIRAVIISGEGRAFCAGDDLVETDRIMRDEISLREACQFLDEFQAVTRALLSMPKPIIAAMHGAAVGAGAEIAIASDVRIMARDGYIMFAESKRGLFQTNGVIYLLPRIVGYGRATHLMMSADKLRADEALTMGLVTQVCDNDALMQTAQSLAQKLAANSPLSLRLIKQAMQRTFDLDLESAMQLEVDGMMQCLVSNDMREGVRAFVEKRAPKFTGK